MKMMMLCLFVISLTTGLQEKSKTELFLKDPFDLQAFKKIKRGSNSGIFKQEKFHFKPEVHGRYFYFFLFQAPGAFVYSGAGDERERVRSGNGFQIVTYKPDGKFQEAFIDPTETLVEFTATYNDPDLPEMAFVGLDSLIVKEKLGKPDERFDNFFIYHSEKNVLVLKMVLGKVKCLKYVRMNEDFNRVRVPARLIEMKCENQPMR